ncbi:MAG: hypothetical protein R6X23_06840 [Acidimicrobiia bacterium]
MLCNNQRAENGEAGILTFAPSSAKRTAVARPMPRVDPVTIATLSSSRPGRDCDDRALMA